MPVWIVCRNCGLDHRTPERTFDPETGTTSCPECGARPFTVRRECIVWHPGIGGGYAAAVAERRRKSGR